MFTCFCMKAFYSKKNVCDLVLTPACVRMTQGERKRGHAA